MRRTHSEGLLSAPKWNADMNANLNYPGTGILHMKNAADLAVKGISEWKPDQELDS